MEPPAPIVLIMLASLIQIVPQILIRSWVHVPKIFHIKFYSQGLILSILTVPCIPAVQVHSCWVVIICSQHFIGKVLWVPPETTAHAYGIREHQRTLIHCITTDQPTQTATSNRIPSLLHPIDQPLLSHDWLKLLLNEIQVQVPLTSKLVFRVVWISVFVHSVVCVPDTHNDDLANLSLTDQIVKGVLDFPCHPECCSTVVE